MAVARLYLPDTNTSRHLLLAIANSLKVMDRNGNISSIGQQDEKWSRLCSKRFVVTGIACQIRCIHVVCLELVV